MKPTRETGPGHHGSARGDGSTQPALLWAAPGLAVLAHVLALRNGFVLDDFALLVENPYLDSVGGLSQIVTSELFQASGEFRNVPYYRPLTGAVYWLSFQLLGDDSLLQHAFNVLLHATVTFLLARLLRLNAIAPFPSFVLSALFAIHPATPEVVSYLGGRQDLIGWLVVMSGSVFLSTPRSLPLILGASFVSSFLAVGAREFFLVAPLLLAASTHASTRASVASRRGGAVAFGTGTLGIITFLAIREALDIAPLAPRDLSVGSVVTHTFPVLGRLVHVVFWPNDVAVDVSIFPSSLFIALGGLAVGGLLSVVVQRLVGASAVGSKHLCLFGLVAFWWTALIHAPVAIKYGIISDRYAYDALLGVICILASSARILGRVLELPLRAGLARALCFFSLLALIPLTWARTSDWQNEESLQIAMYRARPEDPESLLAEGRRLFRLGKLDAAYPHCLAYTKARPEKDKAGLCLGAVYLTRGNPKRAAAALEPYSFGRPGNTLARVLLFQAWFASGNIDGVERGLDYFEKAYPEAEDLRQARHVLERHRQR